MAARTVFLSRTSEFAAHPAGRSYVDAAQQACHVEKLVPQEMTGWTAASGPSAGHCRERVRGCDVYVGIIGFNYGSPVNGEPERSYTELEYEAAKAAGKPTLLFLLAEDGEMPPGPALGDAAWAERQAAFRRRLKAETTVAFFRNPDQLQSLVEKALRSLKESVVVPEGVPVDSEATAHARSPQLQRVGTSAEHATVHSDPRTIAAALSADVREHYAADIAAATVCSVSMTPVDPEAGLPEPGRSALAGDAVAGRARDVVRAMILAIEVRDVLHKVTEALALSRLLMLYHETVGAWPRHGTSLDALLVEAALATIAERRGAARALPTLARFALAIAVEQAMDLESPEMKRWLHSQGHRLIDAHHYRRERLAQSTGAWLLLDLGPEPTSPAEAGAPPSWPGEVLAVLYTRAADPFPLPLTYESSEEGLYEWLRSAVRRAIEMVGEQRIVVDLVAPYHLLCRGLEHEPLVDVDGECESLTMMGSTCLRWSGTRQNNVLRSRVLRRAGDADWSQEAAIPEPQHCIGGATTQIWRETVGKRPWLLLDREDVTENNLLRTLLRSGSPYMAWRQGGLNNVEVRALVAAATEPPVEAREMLTPLHLQSMCRERPLTVLWDNPKGRDGFPVDAGRFQGPVEVR